jgi:hypothetical protein
VVLRWHLQRGTVVVPRSRNPAHIEANLAALAVPELGEGDLAAIDALDAGKRLGPHPDEFNWSAPPVRSHAGAQRKDLDTMPFQQEMNDARACLARRDWSSAYAHFCEAHDLGHDVRASHRAAHRGALHAAWAGRRPDRVVYQAFFLGFAALTA